MSKPDNKKMKKLYVVLKISGDVNPSVSVDWITFDEAEAEKMCEGEWGDCVHTCYEYDYVCSASMSKEIFELLMKLGEEDK